MSILTEELPTSIGGVEISSDFRAMIRYESLLFAPSLTSEAKIATILSMFYPCGYGRMKQLEAWNAIQWFYRCGKTATPNTSGGRRSMAAKAYDWEQDAPLILAAFQQAYGMNLTEEHIHWWRFRALFDNLPADCRLCKIMEYRVANTEGLPERTRAYYEKMRRIYALDRHLDPGRPITLEEHDAAFIARLRRDG